MKNFETNKTSKDITDKKLEQMYKTFEKKVQKIEAIQKQENEKLNTKINNKI
jgi:hypothetical protein